MGRIKISGNLCIDLSKLTKLNHNSIIIQPATLGSFHGLAVEYAPTLPQPRSRLFRCDVSLRLGQKLESHKELADGRRPEKRGIKVHVEVACFGLVGAAVQGRLVYSRA